MSISIELSGIEMDGRAQLLNNAKIQGSGDAKIKLNNVKLSDDAKLLDRLEVGQLLDGLEQALWHMDPASNEYMSLKRIVEMKGDSPQSIKTALRKHLGTFTQGVLSNVVAGYISKKIP